MQNRFDASRLKTSFTATAENNKQNDIHACKCD